MLPLRQVRQVERAGLVMQSASLRSGVRGWWLFSQGSHFLVTAEKCRFSRRWQCTNWRIEPKYSDPIERARASWSYHPHLSARKIEAANVGLTWIYFFDRPHKIKCGSAGDLKFWISMYKSREIALKEWLHLRVKRSSGEPPLFKLAACTKLPATIAVCEAMS